MSRRITIVLSCGAFALGGIAVAGCGKDTNADDLGSTTDSATTATTNERGRTATTPGKHTTSTPGRHTTSTAKGQTKSGKPAKAPKPTKAGRRPKASVLERATLVVVMKNDKFAPARLRAKVGQPITWRNDDRRTHNVTAVGGAGFRSGPVKASATYTFKPRKTGPINYVCTIHPGQRGRIDVIS